MPALFTAREIAYAACELIGEVSPADSTIEDHVLERALRWLDIDVAALAAEIDAFWLVPSNIVVPLKPGKTEYNLETETDPTTRIVNGVEFVLGCQYYSEDGRNTSVEIVAKSAYDELDQTRGGGQVMAIAVDRTHPARIFVWPIPSETDQPRYLELRIRSYSPVFLSAQGRDEQAIAGAWQKWAIYQTAADAGSGPVRKIPETEIQRLTTVAENQRNVLINYEDKEHNTDPKTTKFRHMA